MASRLRFKKRWVFLIGFLIGAYATYQVFQIMTFCTVENMINDGIEWIQEKTS